MFCGCRDEADAIRTSDARQNARKRRYHRQACLKSENVKLGSQDELGRPEAFFVDAATRMT